MDNAFLTWLKSAVIFGIVFGLSACDKLNSPKSTNHVISPLVLDNEQTKAQKKEDE